MVTDPEMTFKQNKSKTSKAKLSALFTVMQQVTLATSRFFSETQTFLLISVRW